MCKISHISLRKDPESSSQFSRGKGMCSSSLFEIHNAAAFAEETNIAKK